MKRLYESILNIDLGQTTNNVAKTKRVNDVIINALVEMIDGAQVMFYEENRGDDCLAFECLVPQLNSIKKMDKFYKEFQKVEKDFVELYGDVAQLNIDYFKFNTTNNCYDAFVVFDTKYKIPNSGNEKERVNEIMIRLTDYNWDKTQMRYDMVIGPMFKEMFKKVYKKANLINKR